APKPRATSWVLSPSSATNTRPSAANSDPIRPPRSEDGMRSRAPRHKVGTRAHAQVVPRRAETILVEHSSGPGVDRHFSGVITNYLVNILKAGLGDAGLDRVRAKAGESRSFEELTDDSTWSSYTQVRKLLEAAA